MVHVDSLLDRIRHNKLKTFDAANLEQLRKLNAIDLKELNRQYQRCLEDFKAAIKGDEFCTEAYSNFTKPQLKVAVEVLKNLKALKPDAKQTGKKIRLGSHTPRRKKEKPPEEIVKKVLYLEKDTETGVTSRKPTELIGASQLWVYNAKTRKLGCYFSKNGDGLSVKGTTILGYDEKRSNVKMLRKPKQQLRDFLTGQLCFDEETDNWMWQFWTRIRAVSQPISPRLSRETILLKALRS